MRVALLMGLMLVPMAANSDDGISGAVVAVIGAMAQDNGYDIAAAVFPTPNRVYADRATQGAFEAWNAAWAQSFAQDVESAQERDRRVMGESGPD